MSDVIQVDDNSFEQEVIQADLPVLVDFWAPWCGPCRMVGPVIEQLAEQYQGRIKVAKVNTDESQQVAMTVGIRSIPTVVLFDGPEVAGVLIGARPKEAFAQLIDEYLDKRQKNAGEQAAKAESSEALA